jgi:hypothetical protein
MDESQLTGLIASKWEELTPSKDIFKIYCKTFAKGGILILDYHSHYVKNPRCCFVEDDSGGIIGNGSEKWVSLTSKIANFEQLYKKYDPSLHYFIFITIHVLDNYYGQLVRLNYSGESR